ncbi:MAG: thioredoxin family protein [Lentibacter sp.]|uniref:thioredoxin family protein n=1 Tax=Lentibacter sp. TaxID=2024994 RepID=UPI002606AEF3|nr:thioredoxin family protein [Lentibacter sp.]MDG1290324.1 thioredoxin family protein [Lentibacter sp.]
MKTIKVFGPGCKRCEATAEMVKAAAAELGLEVDVEKVTDARAIAMAGVMSTPGFLWRVRLCMQAACPTPASSKTGSRHDARVLCDGDAARAAESGARA